jgi:molybdopterin biosynthesis enzyme
MEQYRNEIDEGTGYLGYAEAFASVVDAVPRLEPEELSLDTGVGRIAAEDVVARISYPSQDVSLKDGYAVISGDIAAASPENKIGLEVIGAAFAGAAFKGEIRTGQAVKICSGAPIPLGVEAVLSEEFCEELSPGRIAVSADAGPGRNILRCCCPATWAWRRRRGPIPSASTGGPGRPSSAWATRSSRRGRTSARGSCTRATW